MPAKRQAIKSSEKALGETGDSSPLPEKCGDVAAALKSASHLPEACRMMLMAGLEWSLGVDASKRDSGQEMIVGFIGEELKRRKAEFLTKTECFEANAICALTVADEHAETLRKAEETVAMEMSLVNAKRAIFDEDDNQVKLATDLAAAAKSARSAKEAEILAEDLERDLCQQGRKLVNEGAESSEIKTQQLTQSISMIQQLATKLGLEQSLVLTLQFIAKKPMEEWSKLEAAAAQMIAQTFAKHLLELEGKAESGKTAMSELTEAAEVAQKKLDATKECCVVSAAAFREAQSRHLEVGVTAKQAKEVAKQSAAELERARKQLMEAQEELAAFCEGPMETFLTLKAEIPVDREVGTKCKFDVIENEEDSGDNKKARLVNDAEDSNVDNV